MASQHLLAEARDFVPAAPTAGVLSAVGGVAPEAEDQYFANDHGLNVPFDFDYEAIIDFNTKKKWAEFVFVPVSWISVICCYPCFLSQNVEWTAEAQHVALTIDGIRYVQEKHPSYCGMSCTDVGKTSKTVPYDKITDCDLQEPAGMACVCCVPETLTVVRVDTASSGDSGGVARHDLELAGLKHAGEFKRAVWDMKRGTASAGASAPAAQLQAPRQNGMELTVLMEIRSELQQLTSLLKEQAKSAGGDSSD
mmetsp:Transcript_99626/g.321198  ORF Transcript_99626/g.321198 Transcript_99626/m.321198 type:complete len:252 (-) Transcript_99626:150-905(-)